MIIIFDSIAGTQSGGISIQWILLFKNSLWLHILKKKLAQSYFQPFNLVYSTVDTTHTTLNLSADNRSNIFSLLALLLFPEQSREWKKIATFCKMFILSTHKLTKRFWILYRFFHFLFLLCEHDDFWLLALIKEMKLKSKTKSRKIQIDEV